MPRRSFPKRSIDRPADRHSLATTAKKRQKHILRLRAAWPPRADRGKARRMPRDNVNTSIREAYVVHGEIPDGASRKSRIKIAATQ